MGAQPGRCGDRPGPPGDVGGPARRAAGLTEDDVVGSAYCIRNYHVDDHLGGDAGLAVARDALAARGVGLVLDFVPNHVAPDHPWVAEHPEYFVQGTQEDLDARSRQLPRRR